MSDKPLFWGGTDQEHSKPWVTLGDVPSPLYTKCTQSWQGANIDLQLYNGASFYAAGPHPRLYEHG